MISEILRLYGPVPATGFREIQEDGVTVGDYVLAKGTLPLINVAAIHKNPKYWIKGYDAAKHQDVDMNEIHLEFWLDDGVFSKKLQSGTLTAGLCGMFCILPI